EDQDNRRLEVGFPKRLQRSFLLCQPHHPILWLVPETSNLQKIELLIWSTVCGDKCRLDLGERALQIIAVSGCPDCLSSREDLEQAALRRDHQEIFIKSRVGLRSGR